MTVASPAEPASAIRSVTRPQLTWLESELRVWQADGLVDEAQVAQILARYRGTCSVTSTCSGWCRSTPSTRSAARTSTSPTPTSSPRKVRPTRSRRDGSTCPWSRTARPGAPTASRPPARRRGRTSRATAAARRVTCGIESWFAGQDEALRLEQELGDGAVATVKVDGRGNAAIVALTVG